MSCDRTLFSIQNAAAGNRTRVTCVTGRYTNRYTTATVVDVKRLRCIHFSPFCQLKLAVLNEKPEKAISALVGQEDSDEELKNSEQSPFLPDPLQNTFKNVQDPYNNASAAQEKRLDVYRWLTKVDRRKADVHSLMDSIKNSTTWIVEGI